MPNSSIEVPFVFLGDDAFAMKPYPQRGLTVEKRIYNYRHSRARRISENLFGIISNRWRVLRAPILLPPKSVETIVMTILVLHNYLRQSLSLNIYCPPGLSDVELPTAEYLPGQWRTDELTTHSFFDFSPSQHSGNVNVNAKEVRNILTNYFVNEGQVPWEWENC